nr:MAG TPA: hypothetical protein [Caudoviricetes sp.]
MFQFMLHSSVISKSLNLLPCPPPGTRPPVCRLRRRTRLHSNINKHTTISKAR